jgi:hypothetical protein
MAEVSSAPAVKPSVGKVTAVENGIVVFNPTGTRYEFRLAGSFKGEPNTPVKCKIRVKARKVYTVPSGGSFVSPIYGPPRIVQGQVRSADNRTLVVQAAECSFHVELPAEESGIDLDDGPIYAGRLVNVVCEPGARVEFPG